MVISVKWEGGCIEGALPTPGESGSARSRENSHKMAAKKRRERHLIRRFDERFRLFNAIKNKQKKNPLLISLNEIYYRRHKKTTNLKMLVILSGEGNLFFEFFFFKDAQLQSRESIIDVLKPIYVKDKSIKINKYRKCT